MSLNNLYVRASPEGAAPSRPEPATVGRDQTPIDPRQPPQKKPCLHSPKSRRARSMAFMEDDPVSDACPELVQVKQLFSDRALDKVHPTASPAPSSNTRATLAQIMDIFRTRDAPATYAVGEYYDCDTSMRYIDEADRARNVRLQKYISDNFSTRSWHRIQTEMSDADERRRFGISPLPDLTKKIDEDDMGPD